MAQLGNFDPRDFEILPHDSVLLSWYLGLGAFDRIKPKKSL
jgi:hypothetical protein